MQWNQDDPVRQTNNADKENPCDDSARYVLHRESAHRFRPRLAQRSGNQRRDYGDQCSQSIKPVVEHSEGSRPAEAINANDRNQIACEDTPGMRLRCELTEVLKEGWRRDLSDRGRAALFSGLRHFKGLEQAL